MKTISCEQAQERLPAYRDGELSLDDQILVRAHVAGCARCASDAEMLGQLGAAIRSASLRRVDSMNDALGSVHARVVARIQAEQPQRSTARRLRDFDDGHLLWAAAGATVATFACILAILGVMRMSLREAPYSMAAVLGAMADPGSNRNPLMLDSRVLLPRADPDAFMPSPLANPGEGWFAVSAVVTREGNVRDVVVLPSPAIRAENEERDILDVLDAAAQTRFEPARAGGTPVAVNVVWLLAHTTVVGKEHEMVPTPVPAAIRRSRDAAAPRAHGTPVSSRTQASIATV